MSDDLRGAIRALHAAHQSESAALRGDPVAELDGLSRRIRRRRTARAAVTGVATLAAVLVVAVGAAAVTGRWDGPRPATPTPARPTSTPTPTSSPTPAPTVDGPTVTTHALLPTAVPMSAGQFAQTDERWHMVAYYSPDDSHPAVLYLVDPDGALVEVPTPVTPQLVGDWLPGTSLVTLRDQVVDVLTGVPSADFTGEDGQEVSLTFVGDGTTDVLVDRRATSGDADARRLSRESLDGASRTIGLGGLAGSGPAAISPLRDRMAVAGSPGVTVVDLATMAPLWFVPVTALPAESCDEVAWVGASTLVAQCGVGTGGFLALWLLSDGQAPRRVAVDAPTAETPIPDGGLQEPRFLLGDRLVFASGQAGDLGTRLWVVDAEGALAQAQPTRSLDCSGPADGARVTCVFTSWTDQTGTTVSAVELASFDPLTGETNSLIPVLDVEHSALRLVHNRGSW